jgi:hypothetical protein
MLILWVSFVLSCENLWRKVSCALRPNHMYSHAPIKYGHFNSEQMIKLFFTFRPPPLIQPYKMVWFRWERLNAKGRVIIKSKLKCSDLMKI